MFHKARAKLIRWINYCWGYQERPPHPAIVQFGNKIQFLLTHSGGQADTFSLYCRTEVFPNTWQLVWTKTLDEINDLRVHRELSRKERRKR